jgi:hypothetical protein
MSKSMARKKVVKKQRRSTEKDWRGKTALMFSDKAGFKYWVVSHAFFDPHVCVAPLFRVHSGQNSRTDGLRYEGLFVSRMAIIRPSSWFFVISIHTWQTWITLHLPSWPPAKVERFFFGIPLVQGLFHYTWTRISCLTYDDKTFFFFFSLMHEKRRSLMYHSFAWILQIPTLGVHWEWRNGLFSVKHTDRHTVCHNRFIGCLAKSHLAHYRHVRSFNLITDYAHWDKRRAKCAKLNSASFFHFISPTTLFIQHATTFTIVILLSCGGRLVDDCPCRDGCVMATKLHNSHNHHGRPRL